MLGTVFVDHMLPKNRINKEIKNKMSQLFLCYWASHATATSQTIVSDEYLCIPSLGWYLFYRPENKIWRYCFKLCLWFYSIFSVCCHNNSWKTQPIQTKFLHMTFDWNSSAKFENGHHRSHGSLKMGITSHRVYLSCHLGKSIQNTYLAISSVNCTNHYFSWSQIFQISWLWLFKGENVFFFFLWMGTQNGHNVLFL